MISAKTDWNLFTRFACHNWKKKILKIYAPIRLHTKRTKKYFLWMNQAYKLFWYNSVSLFYLGKCQLTYQSILKLLCMYRYTDTKTRMHSWLVISSIATMNGPQQVKKCQFKNMANFSLYLASGSKSNISFAALELNTFRFLIVCFVCFVWHYYSPTFHKKSMKPPFF